MRLYIAEIWGCEMDKIWFSVKGFTLVEAMIALLILTIGILGVSTMQTGTIKANSTANARSEANNVGMTFVEVLQQIPYDALVLADSNNNKITGLDDAVGDADYGVVSADFQDDKVFENLRMAYTVTDDSTHTLSDARGKRYQVYWNIADQSLSGGSGKIIRLFVNWSTPMGPNSLVVTAVKYKNIAL